MHQFACNLSSKRLQAGVYKKATLYHIPVKYKDISKCKFVCLFVFHCFLITLNIKVNDDFSISNSTTFQFSQNFAIHHSCSKNHFFEEEKLYFVVSSRTCVWMLLSSPKHIMLWKRIDFFPNQISNCFRPSLSSTCTKIIWQWMQSILPYPTICTKWYLFHCKDDKFLPQKLQIDKFKVHISSPMVASMAVDLKTLECVTNIIWNFNWSSYFFP